MAVRGFDAVRQIASDVEARRKAAMEAVSRPRTDFFRIAAGETARVRFLEQGAEAMGAWCCQVPPPPGRSWGSWEPTRDQEGDGSIPCPMAERGLKRSFRGWINLIHRDAPVFARDQNNRVQRDSAGNFVIVGHEDRVRLWEVGIIVFNELALLDTNYKGLSSRDFTITRFGSRNDTRYSIQPADVDAGPQPMSENDRKLADNKYDLTTFATPKSYEAIQAMLGGGPAPQVQTADVNPFMQER